MRITRLKMENFGLHRHLEAQMNGSVIGLLGPNGSGKSTVMRGIEYLLTGELPDDAAGWIYHGGEGAVDAKSGKASKLTARLEMDFLKNGQPGKIWREIRPSGTKRGLTWEGNEVTAASAVDQALREIFDADKRAIQSCVFVSQGELANLLFGKPAEREALFVKLLQMSHMQNVSTTSANNRRMLLAEVEDCTLLKDELRARRDQVSLDLLAARKTFAEMADHTEELKALNEMNGLSARLTHQVQSITHQENEEARMKQSLLECLQGGGFADLAELQARITAIQDELDTISPQLNQQSRAQQARRNIDQVRQLRDKLAQLRQQPAVGVPTEEKLRSVQMSLEKTQAVIRVASERVQTQAVLLGLNAGKAEATKRLSDLEATIPPGQLSDEKQARLSDLTVLLRLYGEVEHAHGANCLLCRQAWPSDLDIKKERARCQKEFEALQAELRTAHLANQEATRQLREARSVVDGLDGRINSAQSQLEQQTSQLASMGSGPYGDPDGTAKVADLELMLKTGRELRQAADRLTGQIAEAANQLEASQAALAPDEEALSALFDVNILHGLAARDEALRQVYGKLVPQSTTAIRLDASIKALRVQIDTAVTDVVVLRQTLRDQCRSRGLENHEGALVNRLQQLNAEQAARHSQSGVVDALIRSLDQTNERLLELEVREARDRAKIQVADDLRTIEAAFDRSGLPRTYCRYRFEQLAVLTQENLQSMGADFMIDTDPDTPLSFLFSKADDPSGYVMPQSKLSGGQRVRLSVAFLLAVQRLVIPTLGFLVLDEPSLHLDKVSRTDLKELLEGLGAQLSTSEAQVWVCDHSEDLMPAFQQIIQLGSS